MRISLDKHGMMPVQAHNRDAGFDLKSPVACVIPEGGMVMIDTGVHVELPDNTCGKIWPRSSMFKKGALCEGTIDEAYRGAIKVCLWNIGSTPIEIDKGDRIAQLVICPVNYVEMVVVDSLTETDRGDGGFGSTGR